MCGLWKSLEQLQGLIGVLVFLVVRLYAQRGLGRARGKRATTHSSVFEVMDEVFNPARHTATVELRAQHEQGPLTPVPDDWLTGPPIA
jgi:HEAT repeat protein